MIIDASSWKYDIGRDQIFHRYGVFSTQLSNFIYQSGTFIIQDSFIQICFLLSQILICVIADSSQKSDKTTIWNRIHIQVLLFPSIKYHFFIYSLNISQHARDLNPEEVNSAVENIYWIGCNDVASPFNLLRDDHLDSSLSEVSIAIKNEALLEITAHLLREPAFDQLRTKEQLGYIVFTSIKKVNFHVSLLIILVISVLYLCFVVVYKQISNYLGLHMIVQSGHKGPKYLNWRIESFLKQYRAERLVPMTLEEFNTNIQAVIETILEKPKNLDEV